VAGPTLTENCSPKRYARETDSRSNIVLNPESAVSV
jgi:hypothetical protein